MMTRKDYVATAEILKFASNKKELRRSNAAQPVRNKKKYTRKIKHKNKMDQ